MAKRSIAAVLIIAALLLIPSCDAETFMRKFGTNVLGGLGTEETINKIDDQVELIISGAEDSEGGSNYDDLVNLVVQATRNPDTESKMIESLSKTPGNPQEAASTLKAEINTILDEVNSNMDSSISIDDLTDNIDDIKENIDALEDIPSGLKSTAKTAVDNLKQLVDGINGVEGAYVPTKGDVVIIKTIASVADTILGELSSSSETEGEGPAMDVIIDKVNEALKMYNTVRPATVFRNLNLNGVIDELLSSMNGDSSSPEGEGGTEEIPEEGVVTE